MEIQKIIEKAGGASLVAEVLDISHQAVYKWKEVPHKRVRLVAQLSGLTPETIRPDIF